MNIRKFIMLAISIFIMVMIFSRYRSGELEFKLPDVPSYHDEKERPPEEKLQDSKGRVTCPLCMGSGKFVSEGRSRVCGICRGAGYKMLPRLQPGYSVCKTCHGFSKIVVHDKKTNAIIGYKACTDCRRGIIKDK